MLLEFSDRTRTGISKLISRCPQTSLLCRLFSWQTMEKNSMLEHSLWINSWSFDHQALLWQRNVCYSIHSSSSLWKKMAYNNKALNAFSKAHFCHLLALGPKVMNQHCIQIKNCLCFEQKYNFQHFWWELWASLHLHFCLFKVFLSTTQPLSTSSDEKNQNKLSTLLNYGVLQKQIKIHWIFCLIRHFEVSCILIGSWLMMMTWSNKPTCLFQLFQYQQCLLVGRCLVQISGEEVMFPFSMYILSWLICP